MNKFIFCIKIFLYVVVVSLISTFVLGKILNCSYLLSFTDFDSNGGVWLMFVFLIFGVHLSELRILVKEIIKEKIQSYSGEMLYQDMKNRTINDKEYIADIDNKINHPDLIAVIKKDGEENVF